MGCGRPVFAGRLTLVRAATALRPRWLGLLAVALLFVVAFVQLGRWQLGVAEDKALKEQLEAAKKVGVVELSTVLQPHSPFPGELSATGSRHGDVCRGRAGPRHRPPARRADRLVGCDRAAPTPARPAGAARLRDLTGRSASTSGRPVTVRGGLAPAESPLSSAGLPQGQLRSVDLSVLVNQWSGDLYNAFVFLRAADACVGSHDRAHPDADSGHQLAQCLVCRAVVGLRPLRALALVADGA